MSRGFLESIKGPALPGLIAAIDPGLAGAVALVDTTGRLVAVNDLPVAGTGAQRRIDAAGLAELLRHHAPSLVMVEAVAAMPGQGVSSTFRFGQAVGAVAGVTAVLPLKWPVASKGSNPPSLP